jgi:Uma2 family endonuclease
MAPAGGGDVEATARGGDRVAFMPSAARNTPPIDPTHYPVLKKMGESILQTLIREVLRPGVARWFEQRGERCLVGSDQFIYWVKYTPTQSVAPDLYVLPGVAPDHPVKAWKTWEQGIVPSFALEVVSKDVDKDYVEGPPLYGALGVRELVIFDPEFSLGRDRVRWQVYRRSARKRWAMEERTDADRVRSKVLGCWLRAVGHGTGTRIRLATGLHGDDLVPTPEERCAIAESEVERLRLELEALKRGR